MVRTTGEDIRTGIYASLFAALVIALAAAWLVGSAS
jgi:hypothetical protein